MSKSIPFPSPNPSQLQTSQGPRAGDSGSSGTPNASSKTPARRRVHYDQPELYLNRELSWLRFDQRVLEEALAKGNPLLERVKFLSIFFSNLDEFFMIRVSGLRRQLATGVLEPPPDGMTPAEQLAELRVRLEPLLETANRCWREDLEPKLRQAGIEILTYDRLKRKQRTLLRKHFAREIFPALTPLAFDPSHPFPHISNLSINLAVVVSEGGAGERFARLKVPQVFPRLIEIPREDKAGGLERLGLEEVKSSTFVWLEEVVAANLDLLFPGLEVVSAHPFRVTRDADFEIEEDEASDLLDAMREVVGQRHFGHAVRLEVDQNMPQLIREILIRNLELAPYQVDAVDGPLGQSDLMQLHGLRRPELKDPPFLPVVSNFLAGEESLFSIFRRRDVLLYHPFDSFDPVVDFVRRAANDPQVLAIKQTLYRVGPKSPIVGALMEARENGKQVSALVELRARFDEENNIVWARALERAGVHVVYGLLGLKTHAKLCLVVRREDDGIRRYVHLGTGNYNPVTARTYTDLGLFTTNEEIASDVSDLFNALTGYSRKVEYRRLVVAPGLMRDELIRRIDREIDHHRREGGGHLAFKMNSLADRRCIVALYRASKAGVKVDLQVRGICCLRPGLEGISENIQVTSIVGRFLEHARIFYFRNGGDEDILVGSADLMPRNLDGRVEVLFPVLDPRLAQALRDEILFLHLRDSSQASILCSDGSYLPHRPKGEEPPFDSQVERLAQRGSWHLDD